MIGKINIIGDIGSFEDEAGNMVKGVDLIDVVSQVNEQRALGALSFEVVINSNGGFCDVGYSIHDYLKTIPESIKTIVQEKCASIATVIFLAGDVRETSYPLMIHNPWISGVKGDADQVQMAADEIRAEEDKLINFYAKYTGMEKIALDALMKQETYIYPDMAHKLGFSTVEPKEKINKQVAYKAVAKIKDNMADTKQLVSKMETLLNKVEGYFKPKPKSLMVVEQGGQSLEIVNADGTDLTGLPMAGNLVMIDGAAAPDGSYVLTDMSLTIEVVGGIITAVADATAAAAPVEETVSKKEYDKVVAEMEEWKALLEESEKNVTSLTERFDKVETLLANMQGKTELPKAKAQFRDTEEVENLLVSMNKRREELKNKKK